LELATAKEEDDAVVVEEHCERNLTKSVVLPRRMKVRRSR
jgi:hypothetical protein